MHRDLCGSFVLCLVFSWWTARLWSAESWQDLLRQRRGAAAASRTACSGVARAPCVALCLSRCMRRLQCPRYVFAGADSARRRALVSHVFRPRLEQHDACEFLVSLLAVAWDGEVTAGRCCSWAHCERMPPVAEHVDRLFSFVVETRKRCMMCCVQMVSSWRLLSVVLCCALCLT